MFIDIAVALLLFSWLFRGYRRGLLGEVVHLGGVVLGVMFAGNLVRLAAEKVEPHLSKIPADVRPSAMHLGAIAVIAIAVWIIGSVTLGRNRGKWFGGGPSPVDRAMGAGLAVAVTGVVVCLLVAGADQLPKEIRQNEIVKQQIDQSVSVQWASKTSVSSWLMDVPEMQDAVAHAQIVFDKVRHQGGKKASDRVQDLRDELLK
jgi:uncharacterized membrane protein required for colicin V production